MVLKVVTGKIQRTLELSSCPTPHVPFWDAASNSRPGFRRFKTSFAPAGAYRHSAFTHGSRRGLHSCAASRLDKLSKIADYLLDNLCVHMLSESEVEVKAKNSLVLRGGDNLRRVPRRS